MNAHNIINVSGLSCEIDSTPILENVSFGVGVGDYLSILGPNGAGKTTLLKCLNRILPISGGSITLDGRDLSEYNQKQLARRLGYVPQARGISLSYSVREFLLMSRYPYLSPFHPPGAADREKVDEMLKEVALAEFSERPMATLSGGECQKVLIAAALVQEAPVLLLDEPTTFLDPRYQVEINTLLRRLNRENGTTILAVSHDVNSSLLNSTRVLALKQGRTAFSGTVDDALAPDELEKIFDVPFTIIERPGADAPIVVADHEGQGISP